MAESAATQVRPGTRIPGSKYLRDYCKVCGESIRVKEDAVIGDNCCPDCDYPGWRKRVLGFKGGEDDTSPAWENGIKALER